MSRSICYYLPALVFLFTGSTAQQHHVYTLAEILEIAKHQSIQAKLNENILKNKQYQFYTYLSNLRPQLALSGNLPQYSKQYAPVIQPGGTQKYLPRYYNSTDVGLSLYQQIPFTGGNISLFTGLNRFDDFNEKSHQYNSIPVSILINQPLLGFNPWKWEKKIEPLKYEEAVKQYAEDMANLDIRTTSLFFLALIAQVNLNRDSVNLKNNQLIYRMEQKRIDLGATSKEKLLQIQLQVLQSRKSIRRSQFELMTAQQNLKSFLGINDRENIALLPPGKLPGVKIDTTQALIMAHKYRPEVTGFVSQMLEAERNLEQAWKSRFQINVNASFGLNNAADRFPAAYRDLKDQQFAELEFNIPILDWGRRKYKVQTATANARVTQYTIAQEQLTFDQEVRNAIINFELLQESIPLAFETDSIALLRYRLALQQYQIGKISITDLNIALGEKDDAAADYFLLLQTFWNAYYQVRKLTLFDFDEKHPLYQSSSPE